MDTYDIIKQIDTEISNLQQARAILIGVAPAKNAGCDDMPSRYPATSGIPSAQLSRHPLHSHLAA
jgi:hypothetical protein